ncbi:MAG: hypothetical protein FWC48_04755 [Actinomycetia bacterium]|nr:hypothetical protein [Actinomycetes bacterium]
MTHFYQKVWFWLVLALAMLVISIVGSVAGSFISRSMMGGTVRGTFPGNGTMMRNFNGGGGSGAPDFNNGGGSGMNNGGSGQ